MISKFKKIMPIYKYNKRQKITTIIIIIIVILLAYLVFGFGRYKLLAIASGSMTGTINKGDAIIIDKRKKEYKVKDIIAFAGGDKIIVHRITRVIKKDGNTYYKTKGDFNKKEDDFYVNSKLVIGQEKIRIPFFGIPSVTVNELING